MYPSSAKEALELPTLAEFVQSRFSSDRHSARTFTQLKNSSLLSMTHLRLLHSPYSLNARHVGTPR